MHNNSRNAEYELTKRYNRIFSTSRLGRENIGTFRVWRLRFGAWIMNEEDEPLWPSSIWYDYWVRLRTDQFVLTSDNFLWNINLKLRALLFPIFSVASCLSRERESNPRPCCILSMAQITIPNSWNIFLYISFENQYSINGIKSCTTYKALTVNIQTCTNEYCKRMIFAYDVYIVHYTV